MPRITHLAWALLCVSAVAQTPTDQCFWKASQQVVAESSPGWFACNNTAATPGGASLCCISGSRCGEDSICHFPNGSQGGSGWYVGGCTDGSFNDPVCPRACTSFAHTYIQYNNTEQLWHCCGDGNCDGTPSDETFQAVAPSAWSALPMTATSMSATRTAAPTSTHSGKGGNGSGNANGNGDGGGSSGLSTGAEVGIGVGCGVAGLGIIAAVVFFCLRRRKRSARANDAEADAMMQKTSYEGAQQQGHQMQDMPAPAYSEQKPPLVVQQEPPRVELGSGVPSPQELASTELPPSELPGEGRR